MKDMALPATTQLDASELKNRIDRFQRVEGQILGEIHKVIVGLDEVIEQVLIALFVGGHCLITGMPGSAKTLMVRTISQALGLKFKRIQFTPDLMPTDITGTDIIEEDVTTGHRSWTFVPGPIFTNVLLADEINRTPPKTQSALLEAMQELSCTVRGNHYKIDPPFFVLATQNPIELEGTYPLPEAQLDRFLMEIVVSYPDEAAERAMLLATTGAREPRPVRTMTAEELIAAQALIRRIPVGESVLDAILRVVRAARPETTTIESVRAHLAWGPGPRASQALMLAARARAVLDGRLAPSVEDVAALLEPVLRHRMALTFAARADGVRLADVLATLRDSLG